MRIFPPRVLWGTKQYDATGLMRATASLWDLWSAAIAERNKAHSLAGLGCSQHGRKRAIIKDIGFSRYLACGGLS